MKLKNMSYAGQKMSVASGILVVDKHGIVAIPNRKKTLKAILIGLGFVVTNK